MVLEILHEADKKRLKELLDEKRAKEEIIDNQIEPKHKVRLRKITKRREKRYNLTQTASILKVHRQTIYYWIKKNWVKPKRDFKGHPVFTVLDIEKLLEWKNSLKINNLEN